MLFFLIATKRGSNEMSIWWRTNEMQHVLV